MAQSPPTQRRPSSCGSYLVPLCHHLQTFHSCSRQMLPKSPKVDPVHRETCRVSHMFLLPWILLLLFRPVRTITLPVVMPPSHPRDFLSVLDSLPAPPLAPRPVFVQEVREEEVMYHLYKNGWMRDIYHRKASTVFMVGLFNDLVRGLTLSLPAPKQAHGNQPHEKDVPFTNTIRSFSAREVTRSKKNKSIVHFSMPFLPPNERLRSAEIRFLRQPTARKRKKARYKMSMAVSRGGRVVEKMVRQQRAIVQRDYLVFDVSSILQTWVNSFHGNITFRFRIPKKLEKSILLSDASLKSKSLIALYLEDREFLNNMYESYTTDSRKVKHKDPGKTSHNRTANSDNRQRAKREASNEDGRRKSKSRSSKRWYRATKQDKCQLYNFKVDFDLIGWGQWIIHPKDYNARFCYGDCPSPVDSRFKPTNHALLQTLMRKKKRRLAPPTCCVPISLRPLSMLYFEYDEIVVRHHEDMIADECGCR